MRKSWSALVLVCLGPGLMSTDTVAAELTGIVRDNHGLGLSNLTVKASYYDSITGPTQAVAFTDTTGHFSLSGEGDSWNVEVAPAELNAQGYLSVAGQSPAISENASIRFTTRRLEFTHRVVGQLNDEAGQPLVGYTMRARITENNATFETNVVTGMNGSFQLLATPAVWTLSNLVRPEGVSAVSVFGEQPLEVEVTNLEKQVTITAPRATSTILVLTTNLGGWEIVAQTEAFGRVYRVQKTVPLEVEPASLALEVFNGVWSLSVTSSSQNGIIRPTVPVTPPPARLVAVTNEGVAVMLAGNRFSTVAPTVYPLCVRLVTAGGTVVTNAALSASRGNAAPYGPFPTPTPPGQALCDQDVRLLRLEEGRWSITASTRVYPVFSGWDVTREVVITSNLPPQELTLVFPEPDVGPRLFGTVSASGGPPDGSHLVSLQMTNSGTNLVATLFTDGLGQFGTNVPPGRWEVQTYANCPLYSVVVVSNQNAEVNFAFLVPTPGEPIPVNLSVVDDRGELVHDAWVALLGFDYQTLPADPLLAQPLQPAIWSASLDNNIVYSGTTPSYQLNPTLRWQLAPGTTATNLLLVTRHTTSRIEGRLRDEQGRLLLSGYAAAWTSQNGTNFSTYGAVASGYFSLNVFPGEWQVGAGVSGYATLGNYPGPGTPALPAKSDPTPNSYTTPASQIVRVSNDVARCEFVTTNIPGRITLTVTLVREDGRSVEGVNIFAYGPGSALYTPADLNGSATFTVPPGAHRIWANPGYYAFVAEPQLWPVLNTNFSASSNHIVLVARRPTTCIPGTISNAPAMGLQPQIFASADIHGTNYAASLCPDTEGRFCAPAFPGQWTIAINSSTLPGNGVQTVAPREVTVPPTGAPPQAGFTLAPIVGDFRTARLSPPVFLADGRLRLELEGQAALSWRIERSVNLRDWTLVAIQSAAYRTLVVEESPEPSRRASFYRAVWAR